MGDGPNTASLRDRVNRAATRAGLPIVVVLVAAGGTGAPSLEDTARLRFAEQGLSEAAGDAVLLLVAPRAGKAAIETGKAEAGIVPEIDARRITADLSGALHHHVSATALALAVAQAADRIADSSLATRERRRPLPDPRASEGDEAPAPAAKRDRPNAAAGRESGDDASPHRSFMPGAYALAALVVLGLALRHRRRFGSQARPDAPRRR